MDPVLQQIKNITLQYDVRKIVLFGSRARGDNSPVSDYDIAVFAENMTDEHKTRFTFDIQEVDTLKKIDVLFIDDHTNAELMQAINKDGIVVYG